jgi:lysophospholipase L1-like esterase
MRRLLIISIALTACTRGPSTGPQPATASQPHWFATWGASPYASAPRPPRDSVDRTPTLVKQTVRIIARTSIGGDQARIRLSNEYGDQPLVIGAASIALRDTGALIVHGSDRAITFSGRSGITLKPGAVAVRDPIAFTVPAVRDLAVSLYLTDSIRMSTTHPLALQTNYVARGQSLGDGFRRDTSIYVWPFLTGIDVTNTQATGVIVTIGNSITDGAQSKRDENARWPNVLAERLMKSSEPLKGVVNAGISGGRVLTYGAGPSALARFDRDVLMVPGVTHVILLEGINDIGRSAVDGTSAEDIIWGYKQMIARAHDRGVLIYGATLTPAGPRPTYSPALEAKRAAINTFVRSSGEFDGVIDFDAITRDPDDPLRFLPAYDSGDHLHPGNAGYKAMGEAIDLSLFRRKPR